MADLIASARAAGSDSATLSAGATAALKELGLSPEQAKELTGEAVAWATANGLQIMLDPKTSAHAPFALLPMPFPRSEFSKAMAWSELYNVMVDRMARQPEWLCSVLEGVIGSDAFTARLVSICRAVEAEGVNQTAYLGIFRSDYMLHEPEPKAADADGGDGGDVDVDVGPRLLQVELNTIASSFAGLGSKVYGLHRFNMGRHALALPAVRSAFGVGGAATATTSSKRKRGEEGTVAGAAPSSGTGAGTGGYLAAADREANRDGAAQDVSPTPSVSRGSDSGHGADSNSNSSRDRRRRWFGPARGGSVPNGAFDIYAADADDPLLTSV